MIFATTALGPCDSASEIVVVVDLGLDLDLDVGVDLVDVDGDAGGDAAGDVLEVDAYVNVEVEPEAEAERIDEGDAVVLNCDCACCSWWCGSVFDDLRDVGVDVGGVDVSSSSSSSVASRISPDLRA